ncbi:MAG: glycosyltransferase family 2 protein [Phycisphaerales bacterium]|nr:MAG: glycosyltransferase family 2 protein [Phycisphaerales bacterium]
MSDVTISIVSYCQKSLLDRCLSRIESLGLPETWRIFVVDNNSQDGSADMVAEKYPRVNLIRLKKNAGFGAGHNLAYAQTAGEFFFVLNPDVIVLPGSLEALVAALAERPDAAIVGPCLLNPDGSHQHSARRFYTWRTVLSRRLPIPGRKRVNAHHLMQDRDLKETSSVDWLLGAALGIRRSAFNGNALFDTRYRLYFEDVDACYFARKKGWDILFCPDSQMIHDHQRASAKTICSSAAIHHILSWIKFYIKTKTQRAMRKAHSI